MGVERHYRDLDEETMNAMHTIMDIETKPTEVDLPPMSEILAERTGKQDEKARRKAEQAALDAKYRASRISRRDEQGRSGATGRRKEAVARVTIWPGTGDISVNKRPLDDHVDNLSFRGWMLLPFIVTSTAGLFDVNAHVHGGGKSGQAQALRHGIARALQFYEPSFRPILKRRKMLMRDPRTVERKKPGLAKARKAYQWVKR